MNVFYKWRKDQLIIIEDCPYDSDTFDSDGYFFQLVYVGYTSLEKNSVCIKTFDRLLF
jgi:hypothetical protein